MRVWQEKGAVTGQRHDRPYRPNKANGPDRTNRPYRADRADALRVEAGQRHSPPADIVSPKR